LKNNEEVCKNNTYCIHSQKSVSIQPRTSHLKKRFRFSEDNRQRALHQLALLSAGKKQPGRRSGNLAAGVNAGCEASLPAGCAIGRADFRATS